MKVVLSSTGELYDIAVDKLTLTLLVSRGIVAIIEENGGKENENSEQEKICNFDDNIAMYG